MTPKHLIVEKVDTNNKKPAVDFATYNASLYATSSGTDFRPVIDGSFLRNSVGYQIKHQQMAPIPLFIGSNSDEGLTTFTNNANTSEELSVLVQEKFALNATASDELVSLYSELDSLPPYSQPLDIDWVAAAEKAGFAAGNSSRLGYAIGGDWSVSDHSFLLARGQNTKRIRVC